MITNIVVGALAVNCWVYPLPAPLEEDDLWAQGPWASYTGADSAKGALCALVDPGADPAVITARLERLRLFPRYILLTHGHFDHVAGLAGVASYYRDAYGLAPEIAIHKGDASSLGPASLPVHQESFRAAVGDTAYVDALWEPLPPASRLLSEGDRIGPFTTLHLPGHSPGSAGFYHAESRTLLSGDTLFNGGIGRTDLPGGDWNTLAASLQRLFRMDARVTVYPGHGSITTIGDEQSLL
ncbi:MAG: MBL fold metallo-hydrolase [Spirochaetaceae bacterium]|jgi:glyoxylase-like metal-dependent hydrolase (beta-lactamase superfamily II)|nr:MBL fold metallo-hydrolase [Spirochaetaceae bacterium]